MATIIKIKRSSATTAPSALAQGELALTYGSGTQGNNGDRLFIGTGTETNGEAANIDVIGGQYFTDMLDHVAGTVTASCAAIVDSNSKVDVWNVDNLTLNGNTVSSTDIAGDINITPHTTGDLVLDGQKWPQADGSANQFLKTAGNGQLSWAAVPSGSFTLSADSGSDDTFTTGDTLEFEGGTGIGTTVSDDKLSFAIDATVATLSGAQTLTNKTLTSPIASGLALSDSSIVFEGATANEFETTLTVTDPSADRTITLPNVDGTVITTGNLSAITDAGVFTGSIVIEGTTDDQWETTIAVTDPTADRTWTVPNTSDTFAGTASTQTLTNKTISGGSNTLSDIANASLTNSSITVNGNAVSLGGTVTLDADDLAEGTNLFYTDERVDDRVNALFTDGEGIDSVYDDANGTLTIAGEDASTSNKGIASFHSDNFSVTSGAVIIKNGGVANAELVNSAVSFGGVSVSLGASDATPAFNLSDATAYTGDNALVTVGTIASGTWNGTAIGNNYLANSSLTIGSDTVSLGGTQTDLNGITSLDVDNITVDGNSISSTNTNGNVVIDPNGSGTVDMSSSRITSVTDPTGAQDAATKAYVDAVKTGLDVKGSCKYATTADLSATYANGTAGVGATLTADANGALTVDGATPSVDDRVLVMDQSDAEENGIYTVTTVGNAGAAFVLTRATDADTGTEFTGGTFTFVETGTANADNGYVFTHNGAPTMGTTELAVAQFSGAGQITAGSGMTKSANTMNVVGGTGITANANDIQIAADWTGQNTITTLGTITTGQWQSTDVAVAYGGTGASTFTSNGILYGNAANAIQVTAAGTDGYFLYSNSGTPSWTNQLDGGTF